MSLDLTKIKMELSPHFSQRSGNQKPSYIIVHAAQGTHKGTISWFKNPVSKVSAHYCISKKGEVVQFVRLDRAAWHVVNFNSPSIGIELEDLDLKTRKGCLTDPNWLTDIQLDRLAELTALLMRKYLIPISNVWGHDCQELRKLGNTHKDPGPYFPWDKFKELVKKHLEPNKNEQTK